MNDQLAQAELARETVNPPTEEDEEAVLRELYGAADADGVYGPRGGADDEAGDA